MDDKTELEYLSPELPKCKCGGTPKFIRGLAAFEYTVRCQACGLENNQHENTRLKAFIRWENSKEFTSLCSTIADLRTQVATKDRKIARIDMLLEQAQKCIDDMRARIAGLEAALREIRTELEASGCDREASIAVIATTALAGKGTAMNVPCNTCQHEKDLNMKSAGLSKESTGDGVCPFQKICDSEPFRMYKCKLPIPPTPEKK
jgi:hypothetical protein